MTSWFLVFLGALAGLLALLFSISGHNWYATDAFCFMCGIAAALIALFIEGAS